MVQGRADNATCRVFSVVRRRRHAKDDLTGPQQAAAGGGGCSTYLEDSPPKAPMSRTSACIAVPLNVSLEPSAAREEESMVLETQLAGIGAAYGCLRRLRTRAAVLEVLHCHRCDIVEELHA